MPHHRLFSQRHGHLVDPVATPVTLFSGVARGSNVHTSDTPKLAKSGVNELVRHPFVAKSLRSADCVNLQLGSAGMYACSGINSIGAMLLMFHIMACLRLAYAVCQMRPIVVLTGQGVT